MFLEKLSDQLPKISNNKSCLNYKCYVMTESMFLKDLMLIRQANQKSTTFVTIGIS